MYGPLLSRATSVASILRTLALPAATCMRTATSLDTALWAADKIRHSSRCPPARLAQGTGSRRRSLPTQGIFLFAVFLGAQWLSPCTTARASLSWARSLPTSLLVAPRRSMALFPRPARRGSVSSRPGGGTPGPPWPRKAVAPANAFESRNREGLGTSACDGIALSPRRALRRALTNILVTWGARCESGGG